MILGSVQLGSLDAQLAASAAVVVVAEIISLDIVLLLGGLLGTVTLAGGSLDAVILVGED